MQSHQIFFNPTSFAKPDEFRVGQEAAYSKSSAHISANGMTVVCRALDDGATITVTSPSDAWMLGYLQVLNSRGAG